MKRELTYEQYLSAVRDNIKPDVEFECRGNFDPNCDFGRHVSDFLDIVQGKWKNHILFTMCRNKTMRFGELKKRLPQITSTALTTALRELEEDGMITRVQYNEIPPRVEYSLSPKGEDLMPIYYEMFKWSKKYLY